ncbi:PREDICTED: protein transport protein Sec16B-like [Elephantulus edwardii]|uniref:protein transport protein Sec16B-like n=1 Tax=Elephantulus edwardii TaxID=28737 RepID=UPI0003F0DA7C|nr:PREDICTED: protein transport protein Sec16B-like [Elephantulus edwardii]
MEPWAPPRSPQAQGRPMAPSKDADRGLRRDEYHMPVPHPRHSGKRFYQWQDLRRSPHPQQDPRADHQQLQHSYRPGDWHQPPSGMNYYEGGYPRYPRPGYENLYQNYHSPALREEYAYGSYYYHGHPQRLPEERVPRQGSPYTRHEDYRDQKNLSEHHQEAQNSPFGTNNETQLQSKSWNPYRDSPGSNYGQERPGEVFPDSLLPGAQKNKSSLTSESNLLQQHESGLSSSSYELSQYMTEASDPVMAAAWSPAQAEDASGAGPKAPMKFYVPHVPVSFGPGAQLVCVGLRAPPSGQMMLIELHSMEVILGDSEEQEEMRTFSGPLIRDDVHKVNIMTFCQQKAARSRKSETPRSRDSALLWQLLVLLCRQNGSMVGSDIAELLMQDCKKLEKYERQPPVANLINLSDEDWPVMSSGTPNLLTGEMPPSVETPAQVVEKFTKLLYYGRKKEALEWAMKNHLWGHALFLASKMDPRTYSWVMSGFTSTLALNDPLQTLFQLMSGRIPQAATCCGDKQWGDWRPHLAVILSNQAGDPELHQRAIVTMGDTLAGKGLVEAAHFCYLMAHMPFGYYTVKTDHLALLGSSHSQEFLKFATTEAIQRTEIFEYCQMLGRPRSFIPSFQVYKLLYASRLADYGLTSQALHYCEAISMALLSQRESRHPVLLVELIKLAEKLKLSDPLLLERRRGDRDLEPDWLVQLRGLQEELAMTEQKVPEDHADMNSTHSLISGTRGATTENSVYQDLSGHQGYSEPLGHHSASWPLPESTGVTQPGLQHSTPLQLGSYPGGADAGQMGTQVPLYSIPETHPPGTGSSVAVTAAPGAWAGEENLQTQPPLAENTLSQEPFQHPDVQEVISKPQAPLVPRARTSSENSSISVKEDESSEDEDESSLRNNDGREKPGDAKENTKRSGFGWFSWFRSKPTSTSPSGEEDSSDNPDSEETPRTSSPPQAGPSLSLTPPPVPWPPQAPSTFSQNSGGGHAQGLMPSGGNAEGMGIGALQGPQGVSSQPYFNPGALLPPPTLKGAVPLYNPSQVPQLSVTTSLSRPNRLAQRRYPTQP